MRLKSTTSAAASTSTSIPLVAPRPSANTACDPRPKKRKGSSIFTAAATTTTKKMHTDEPQLFAAAIPAGTTEMVKKDVGPFLSKHIPQQYTSQAKQEVHSDDASEGNTRYCYRHRPDIKCRRPVDEPTMEQLQSVGLSRRLVQLFLGGVRGGGGVFC